MNIWGGITNKRREKKSKRKGTLSVIPLCTKRKSYRVLLHFLIDWNLYQESCKYRLKEKEGKSKNKEILSRSISKIIGRHLNQHKVLLTATSIMIETDDSEQQRRVRFQVQSFHFDIPKYSGSLLSNYMEDSQSISLSINRRKGLIDRR